jgi:predicted RNase H-like nuclease (RuvC/YqgF family)
LKASEGSTQAYEWRKNLAVAENVQTATSSNLQIAQEEIFKLNKNLKKMQNENKSLQSCLEKAERLVYGTVLTKERINLESTYSKGPPRGRSASVDRASSSKKDRYVRVNDKLYETVYR